jgi:phospho-N-acetylmuramoyl-pentapeptide-transferase
MFYHLIYPLHMQLSFLNVFRYITVRAAFAAITAFVVIVVFGSLLIRLLKQASVVQVIREDGPKKHFLTKQNTPTMGGFIILFGFVISMALWGRFDGHFVWIALGAVLWFSFVGFLDDYLKLKVGARGLPGQFKLILQFIGAFFIIFFYTRAAANFPYLLYVNVPFIKTPFALPEWLFYIFTMLIIVGWSNAVNLTDGLDGLAGGLSFFVFVALMIMAYVIGNVKMSEYLLIMNVKEASELAVVCAALAGALLGFLWFNAYPASVFMGDVGALMLGGAIGTLAVLIKQEILMLIVGVVFVVEVLSVILQVASFKITKKRIFRMAPLHHHFQLKGVSEPKLIMRFWISALIIMLLTLATLKLR